ASSCQAFVTSALNAVTAGLLSPLANATPLRLAVTSAVLTAGGLVCTALYYRRSAMINAAPPERVPAPA
ncbi:MAG TPA: hypothetical protein VF551_07755, partial [Chthoniobacterales bacterium]